MASRKLAGWPFGAVGPTACLVGSQRLGSRGTLGYMGLLLLGHISSLEVYDLLGLPGSKGRVPHGTAPVDLPDCACLSVLGPACTSVGLFDERLERSLPHPLHLIVPQRSSTTPTARYIPHGWKYDQPLDDLFRLNPSKCPVYVCPPEMALMQMSRKLSRPRLALLIDQLTGTYRQVRREAVPFYQRLPNVTVELFPRGTNEETCKRATAYGLPPLTTVAQITQYIENMPGAWGSHRVARALVLATDGLASPLEAQQHMLAFCNVQTGSLGLPCPLVNSPLEVTQAAQPFFGVRRIRPDFYWPDKRVALETNGLQWHGGGTGIADTSRRTKGYETMGIRSMTVTYEELASFDSFYAAMGHLAEWLGCTLPCDTPYFAAAKERLFREVVGRGPQASQNEPDRDHEWLDHLVATYDATG